MFPLLIGAACAVTVAVVAYRRKRDRCDHDYTAAHEMVDTADGAVVQTRYICATCGHAKLRVDVAPLSEFAP